jgi:hypothetical protein
LGGGPTNDFDTELIAPQGDLKNPPKLAPSDFPCHLAVFKRPIFIYSDASQNRVRAIGKAAITGFDKPEISAVFSIYLHLLVFWFSDIALHFGTDKVMKVMISGPI